MNIIAFFFPAFISISIYSKRQHVGLKADLRLLIRYGIYVMLVNWCDMALSTYVFGVKDCRLESMGNWSFFTKYLFIAVFFAWIIPYAEEIVNKYIHISFRVEDRKEAAHEDNQKN